MPTSPERAGHGQAVGLDERAQVRAGRLSPAGAAEQHQRPPGSRQHRGQPFDLRRPRAGAHRRMAGGVGHLRAAGQHVFGQRQHHRPHASAGGGLERMRDVFGDAFDAVDLGDPLGHLPEHAAIVDLLERLAVDEAGADLADEQDHRHRVLERRVHADRGIGRPRAARHHHHSRLAGELGIGVGHERGAALLAADHEADAVAVPVQSVEHREVAFAGYPEDGVDVVHRERVGKDPAAGSRARCGGESAHVVSPAG